MLEFFIYIDFMISVTDEIKQILLDEIERTSIRPVRLLKGRRDIPAGLHYTTIYAWLNGSLKSARSGHLDYVLGLWAAYPDRRCETVPLSAGMRRRLKTCRDMSGIGAARLLRDAREAPHGLSADMISNWLHGHNAHVRADHLEFVLNRWERLAKEAGPPDRKASPVTQAVSPSVIAAIKAEITRTGVKPAALLKAVPSCPTGLRSRHIHGWMNGKISMAPPDHAEFVLSAWQALPDIRPKREALSEPVIHRLRALREQTGIGPAALLSGADDLPAGLTAAIVTSWLMGTVASARTVHLSYVLHRWPMLAAAQAAPPPPFPVRPEEAATMTLGEVYNLIVGTSAPQGIAGGRREKSRARHLFSAIRLLGPSRTLASIGSEDIELLEREYRARKAPPRDIGERLDLLRRFLGFPAAFGDA